MKWLYIILLLFPLFCVQLNAQQLRKCATHDKHLELLQNDLEYKNAVEKVERETVDFLRQSKLLSQQNNVITIPVVVHILWRTNQQNISDAQIQSQIDVLNEAFRKLNTNISNTLPDFIDRVGDMEIEFCLASVDPQGLPTNGITRKNTTKASWGTNDAIKKPGQGGVAPWPTNQYLNMWVGEIGGGILGYAQFPGGPAATDGIVVCPQYFGSKAKGTGFFLDAPFDLGATVTHEVGHWVNLRHIWGDGNCSVDDFVGDTPNANGPNYGCPLEKVSCNSLDNVQNYMDYTNDACMTMFTIGQVARSRALFAPGGVRSGLLSSNGCGVPIPTCLAPSSIQVIGNGTSASLTFSSAVEATSYTIYLKEANDTEFEIAGTISGTSITLNNLSTCTLYDLKVESDCSENELGTVMSDVVTFNSKGSGCVCETIQDLTIEVINNTQARLSWGELLNATRYDFEGRLKGGLGLVTRNRNIRAPQTNFVTNALFANLTYEVRTRTQCDGLGQSGWSSWIPFKLSFNGRSMMVGEDERSIDLFPEEGEILRVYPNPASSFVRYNYKGERLNNVIVSLVDLSGRVLKQQRVQMDYDSENSLNVDDLANGIYLLRFNDNGIEMTTQKVVIMR